MSFSEIVKMAAQRKRPALPETDTFRSIFNNGYPQFRYLTALDKYKIPVTSSIEKHFKQDVKKTTLKKNIKSKDDSTNKRSNSNAQMSSKKTSTTVKTLLSPKVYQGPIIQEFISTLGNKFSGVLLPKKASTLPKKSRALVKSKKKTDWSKGTRNKRHEKKGDRTI